MTPQERTLYARQLLLPEIGESGQRRLCETRVALSDDADPRAAEAAKEYLMRAGVRLADGSEQETPNSDTSAVRAPVATSPEVTELAGDERLEEAAAALAGAMAAVEAIKTAVGTGEAGTLPHGLSLTGEPDPEPK